ncbi:MAG: 23S rRNA (adenine(2503)-C(2))-methyltransferase RlmN [Verrucomicrobiota bacterium]
MEKSILLYANQITVSQNQPPARASRCISMSPGDTKAATLCGDMTSIAAVTTMPHALLDLTFGELEQEFIASGLAPIHVRTLWRALYRDLKSNLTEHPDFLPPLHRWLVARLGAGRHFSITPPAEVANIASTDGLTRKFLLRLADGQTIETVVMGFDKRHTACVSTQVGCAMGCVFCATGQMGFVRHLQPGEIVAQVHHAQLVLKATGYKGLRNLVLMGMGEPLHNYDAVMKALEIISDRRGLNLGPGRITISTVGVVPGILRMAAEQCPYNLAVSLHGATEEDRSALVPVSSRWPLPELMNACRQYQEQTRRRIFFEWTLIAGKNDTTEQASRLGTLLAGFEAHVNLIALNPTDGFAGRTASLEAAKGFQKKLKAANIPSTIRQLRGIDVAAGCGQLRAEKLRSARS